MGEVRDADSELPDSFDAATDSDASVVGDAAVDRHEHLEAAVDDAATDGLPADGTGATAPWTPTALPGVVLWLEADWGVNISPGADTVSLWSDRSGHGNDAVQPDMKSTPRVIFDGIGHMPSLRFADPSWMIVIDKPSLRWGLGDFALMVVGRKASSCARCQAEQLFFHKSEFMEPYTGLQVYLLIGTGKVRTFLTPGQEISTDRGGYGDGDAHLFSVRRRATTIEIRADGVTAGSTPPRSPVNLDAPGRHGYIGAHGFSGDLFQFEGDIAAMIAVKGTLSDDDLVRLESYLLMKYDIPGATVPPTRGQ